MANSPSTKELAFELVLTIMEVEKFILVWDEDDDGILDMTNYRST